jgi:hypothetical protein
MAFQGQNFRLLQQDPVTGKYRCFGMSTNASINQSSNTDDATTKDVLGMASMPSVTSKSAQISVETLTITNAVELLKAIASGVPFTLIWDEVSTVNNQTPVGAAFARTVKAFLNDVTLNLNDRENTATSLQFASASPIAKITSTPTYEMVTPGTFIKGQFVRLFLSKNNTDTPANVVLAPKSLSLHVSLSLEDATTKDTEGDWQVQEPTGLSYDISINALIKSGETITSSVPAVSLTDLQDIYEASEPVKWEIAHTSGANNRTKGDVICAGSAVLTALNISAQNRTVCKYDATFNGYGPYETPAES